MGISNDLVSICRIKLPILLCICTMNVVGCIDTLTGKVNTYPCEYRIYSRFPNDVYILNCDGLGRAQPVGLLAFTTTATPFTGLSYPRIPDIPDEFTIKWRDEKTKETFKQRVVFPRIPKGSDGFIRMELLCTNKWEVTFERQP